MRDEIIGDWLMRVCRRRYFGGVGMLFWSGVAVVAMIVLTTCLTERRADAVAATSVKGEPQKTVAEKTTAEKTVTKKTSVKKTSVKKTSAKKMAKVDYNRQIRPLFSNSCYTCHGPSAESREAGLRLDDEKSLLAVLDSENRAVVRHNRAKSELWRRINAKDADERMPPSDSKHKRFTAEQIALIGRWIDEGASFRQHWSFIPPKSAPVPQSAFKNWGRNEIDAFVGEKLVSNGLKPSSEASREKWIRRTTFDVIGLPPTLKEIDDFLSDQSPKAYEKVVDRLLASKHYGEQRARFWLDNARYGDTHGLHLDNYRSIWPYRDWVINAFNSNKGFDKFAVEQIAGDSIPNGTIDQKVASGFGRCNVSTSEGGIIDEEFRVRYGVDRTETFGTVFLGLSIGCAACHTHKYDPISHKEFYSLFAFYANTTDRPKDGNKALPPPFIRIPDKKTQPKHLALQKQLAGLQKEITAECAKIDLKKLKEETAFIEWMKKSHKRPVSKKLPEPIRSIFTHYVADITWEKWAQRDRDTLREYYILNIFPKTKEQFKALVTKSNSLQKQITKLVASSVATLVMEEKKTHRRPVYVLTRGDYDKPDKNQLVKPDVPIALGTFPKGAPRNRLGLARWLVAPQHPLTARVAVNRFWQQFFGIGIVKTSEDFGAQGEWPSHQKLLDWLARDFIDNGWDIKRLIKKIVLSATYRQSSRVTKTLYARDPENRLLARGPRFRLDAEAIRDSALFYSGLLVRKLGGPSVKPYQPDGLWKTVAYPNSNTAKFKKDSGEKLYRRSLYTFWKRTATAPTMAILDAPTRETCSVRRERTNTPMAALALMNDVQFVEAFRNFAEQLLLQKQPLTADRINTAFRMTTARLPNQREQKILLTAYQTHLVNYRKNPKEALKLLSVGDSKRNPKLNPEEHAAWTMLISIIFNLDETITKN